MIAVTSSNNSVTLSFCVFSYNRGEFLRNCVRSIMECAPQCPVSIFDDNSDDPETIEILQTLSTQHQVIQPESPAGASGKHGGLYANMQAAFDRLPDDGLFCFLQDDMQLVRPLSAPEIAAMNAQLEDCIQPRLLQPAFLKGCNRQADADCIRFAATENAYCIDRFRHSAGAWYSDILVAKAGRLRSAGWRFLPRESANERQARETLAQMLYLKNPFAAWLPSVPSYRGRTRTWALRQAERLAGCAFYPLRIMSDKQNRRFLERSHTDLPVAEDFLSLAGDALPTPWISHPLQGRRVLKLLNTISLKFFSP
jgi:glycosyltransferase involved in cell wall biosynthesis